MRIDKVWPAAGMILKGRPLRVNLCSELIAPESAAEFKGGEVRS